MEKATTEDGAAQKALEICKRVPQIFGQVPICAYTSGNSEADERPPGSSG